MKNFFIYTFRYVRRSLIVTGIATASLFASSARAQNLGNILQGALNSDQAQAGGTVQSGAATQPVQKPIDRGIDRAIQGVLQGDTVRDSVRGGASEAFQSSAETPQQTMLRDRATIQAGQNLQGPPGVQPWQVDAQGRAFYQDASGQRVYAQSNTDLRLNRQQNSLNISNNMGGTNRNSGATIVPTQHGLMFQSVTQGGAAYTNGFRAGDVVVSVDGQSVQTEADFYQRTSNGGQVVVLRNGQQLSLTTDPSAYSNSSYSNSSVEQLRHELVALKQRIEKLESDLKKVMDERK